MTENVDQSEIAKFESLAHRWWDPEGDFRTLHDINPLRVDYIARHCELVGKRVVEIGCGGGILAEALAARGAACSAPISPRARSRLRACMRSNRA